MKEYRISTLSVIEEIPTTESCDFTKNDTEENDFIEPNNNIDKGNETSNNDLHGNSDLHGNNDLHGNSDLHGYNDLHGNSDPHGNNDLHGNKDLHRTNDQCEKCGTDNGNDLGTLKEKATKLKLKTRRTSYVTWETEKLVRSGALFKARLQHEVVKDPQDDQSLTPERKEKINSDIGWIRKELHAMRIFDQNLAKKLLSLRHEMHSLKLKWSCDDHKEMMEEVTCDLEERQVLQDVCDLPLGPVDINPLKHLGVTRMHLSARRFSTC